MCIILGGSVQGRNENIFVLYTSDGTLLEKEVNKELFDQVEEIKGTMANHFISKVNNTSKNSSSDNKPWNNEFLKWNRSKMKRKRSKPRKTCDNESFSSVEFMSEDKLSECELVKEKSYTSVNSVSPKESSNNEFSRQCSRKMKHNPNKSKEEYDNESYSSVEFISEDELSESNLLKPTELSGTFDSVVVDDFFFKKRLEINNDQVSRLDSDKVIEEIVANVMKNLGFVLSDYEENLIDNSYGKMKVQRALRYRQAKIINYKDRDSSESDLDTDYKKEFRKKLRVRSGYGKVFMHRVPYSNHLLGHRGIKPYICDVCGRSFAAKSSLFQHISMHRCKQRPRSTVRYTCDHCHESFRDEACFKTHPCSIYLTNHPNLSSICGQSLLEACSSASVMQVDDS